MQTESFRLEGEIKEQFFYELAELGIAFEGNETLDILTIPCGGRRWRLIEALADSLNITISPCEEVHR